MSVNNFKELHKRIINEHYHVLTKYIAIHYREFIGNLFITERICHRETIQLNLIFQKIEGTQNSFRKLSLNSIHQLFSSGQINPSVSYVKKSEGPTIASQIDFLFSDRFNHIEHINCVCVLLCLWIEKKGSK